MGDRRCCCECWTKLDDFDRDDSTTVSGWHEETGDWEIAGYMLHEKAGGTDGTANAKIFYETPIPARSAGEMHMWVEVYGWHTNDVFILYPAATDNSTPGPVRVEFTFQGGSTWQVEVISGSGSEAVKTYTVTPLNDLDGDYVILHVCVDHSVTMVKAWIVSAVGQEYIWLDDLDAGDGRYCGLGHDNETYGAWFDDFGVTEMRKGTVECDNCFCWCLTRPTKKHLHAEIFDATNRASCLEGLAWDMDWEYNAGDSRWYGEVSTPDTTEGSVEDLAFILECETDNDNDYDWPGRNYTLQWAVARCCNLNSPGCSVYRPIAEESTCDPFSLVFGPFTLGCTDLNCNACWDANTPSSMGMCDTGSANFTGQYYIRIVEG